MQDDESARTSTVTSNGSRSRNTYELLMRQSKKLGSFATSTYDLTREFLKKDVTQLVPRKPTNPDKLLFEKQPSDVTQARQRDAIKKVVRKSHEVLASASTVILPMNLFPDTVTVDRTKITITKRTFFWSAQVVSIRVEDILNVGCSVGPLFGSLTVSSRVMNSTDHFEINYFWRKDAMYIKQLIQGYYIAQHNQIETTGLDRTELLETLLELGSDGGFNT